MLWWRHNMETLFAILALCAECPKSNRRWFEAPWPSCDFTVVFQSRVWPKWRGLLRWHLTPYVRTTVTPTVIQETRLVLETKTPRFLHQRSRVIYVNKTWQTKICLLLLLTILRRLWWHMKLQRICCSCHHYQNEDYVLWLFQGHTHTHTFLNHDYSV